MNEEKIIKHDRKLKLVNGRLKIILAVSDGCLGLG